MSPDLWESVQQDTFPIENRCDSFLYAVLDGNSLIVDLEKHQGGSNSSFLFWAIGPIKL